MASPQSAPERTCPNCSAPAEPAQRWCLECGSELPQRQRHAVRSAIGIGTTLVVLIGAASAGGYTLLQDGKQPPPPTQTIAQTPTPTTPEPPPADDPLGDVPAPTFPDDGADGDLLDDGDDGGALPPLDDELPDLEDDFDTTSPPPPPPPDDAPDLDDDGSVRDEGGADRSRQGRTRRRPSRPRLVETNLAFGSTAAAYAPYASDQLDFGDTSRLVDGTTRTVWRSPRLEDPTAHPQMGVFVELASPERLKRLVLSTPTPGMSVEIYASRRASPPGSITDPGWVHLTDRRDLPERATIPLPSDRRFRYVLVWITGLAPGADRAEISELELIGLAPE